MGNVVSDDGRGDDGMEVMYLMIFASPVVAFLMTAGVLMALFYSDRVWLELPAFVAFCLNAVLAGVGSGYGAWWVPNEFWKRVVAAGMGGVGGVLGYLGLCCCGGAVFG